MKSVFKKRGVGRSTENRYRFPTGIRNGTAPRFLHNAARGIVPAPFLWNEQIDRGVGQKQGVPYRSTHRDFSVRLSFENQAWRDATPFLLVVLVEVGDFNGSDEVVYDFYCVFVMSVNFLFFVDKHLVYERSQDFRRQFFKVAAVFVHERDKL